MTLRLDRLHFPVTTLGPGRRLGLWVQGCTLACPGCLARDSWDPVGGRELSSEAIVAAADRVCGDDTPDGVTISGGEPFEQPNGLAEVVPALRTWGGRRGRDLDVLVYSGFPLDHLEAAHPDLLAQFDAIIPEPFEQRAPTDRPWRGSDNQPLVLLSELGRARFAGDEVASAGPGAAGVDAGRSGRADAPSIQVCIDAGRVWLVGVPRPGDLPRLEAALARRGVELQDVSWRP